MTGPFSNPRKPAGRPVDMDYIAARSAFDFATGCWVWTGAVAPNGYGAMRLGAKTMRAHRVAHQLTHGVTVPSSTDVCHTCDNRRCVNPAHLFLGTRADNMADCARKGRIRTPAGKGEDCPASKLTAAQVREIRADNRSQRQLARAYGVERTTIGCIKRGDTWRSV